MRLPGPLLAISGLLASAVSGVMPAATWKSVYFYDEDGAGLRLHDLQWPGPGCAIALGTEANRGKVKHVAVISNDGGKTWALTPLKSHARSAFFLNDRLGWIVTESGLERTGDCGRTWEKLGRQKDIVRVWFRDEALGWAVGAPKKTLETRDGGKTWKDIAAVDPPKSDPDRSIFAWVEFANEKKGVMVGWHQPDRKSPRFPAWMDPEEAKLHRQLPSLTLMLQTLDGGTTWKGFTASVMGRMTRLRLGPDGSGLAVLEFDPGFEWPSEVFGMGVGATTVARVYRDKHLAVTDAAIGSDGWSYLAGVEVEGTMRLPVPTKVKIVRSLDWKNWEPMAVDYRASGGFVRIAVGPNRALMALTDTGMILRLEQ